MSEMAENNGEYSETSENPNTEKFLIFSIHDKLYCFPSRFIGEIAIFEAVYKLPLMPSFMLGVVNRYSIPYALFDIGLLFYDTPTPHNKVLIIKEDIDRISFIINDVEGIADIQNDKLFTINKSTETSDLTDVVSASFSWNEKDVFVLDIHRILSRVTGEAA